MASTNDTIDMAELLKMVQTNAGSATVLPGAQDDIKYHEHGEKFIAVPDGMSMEHVAEVATKKAAELNKVHAFSHQTKYRPEDGAHAAAIVIKDMFGLTIGQATRTMFGENPPEYRTIDISHNEKMEVPWGQLEVPALPGARFYFGGDMSSNGPVFAIQVEAPKKHKIRIEQFFKALDEELERNSIYRGKALLGAYELKFMDVNKFKSREIVFSDHVQHTLDAAVNTVIEHTASTQEAGLPTKRAVLAYGPYGTGKSSLGLITAQKAEAAGWTFLSAKAGKDKLAQTFQTAVLYEPAVVFIEDIDTYTPKASDKDGISEILDLFDGIVSKNRKLLVMMTTNHIEKVPAGMLRPGRLDYIVEIAGLDRNGVERLVRNVIRPDLLDGNVDFDAVFEPMADWQPAWVRAAADRAQSFAIARTGGEISYSLTTDDIVSAANSLKPQLHLMENALEGYETPKLEEVWHDQTSKAVKEALNKAALVDSDDDQVYALRTEKPGGRHWTPRA